MKLLAGLLLLAGVLLVERGLHKPHPTGGGWFDYHLNGGGV